MSVITVKDGAESTRATGARVSPSCSATAGRSASDAFEDQMFFLASRGYRVHCP